MDVVVLGLFLGVASGAEHTVSFSDEAMWVVGMGVTYPDITIKLGESVKFVSFSDHDVVLLHAPTEGAHWDLCGTMDIPKDSLTTIWDPSSFSSSTATEKHYTPPTCGGFHIACSIYGHCMYGQRVKIIVNNADGSACSSPCADGACVTDGSKQFVTSGIVHDVKPAPLSQYWGSGGPYGPLSVEIGDTVLFRTGAGYHDVASVPTLADFNSCNMNSKIVLADWDFSSGLTSATCNASEVCCAGATCGRSGMFTTYTFTAREAGNTYFVCSVGAHCQHIQKFVLTVKSAAVVASLASRSQACIFSIVMGFVALSC